MRLLQENTRPLQTTKGFEDLSGRYQHINSLEICRLMESNGFEHIGTSAANVRDKEREGYQKHLMAFTRPDLVLSDGERMQILCLNSHDGSSSLRFNIGVFRWACANGMVSGEKMHEASIKHLGNVEKNIKEHVSFLMSHTDEIKKTLRDMKNRELSAEEAYALADFAGWQRLEGVKNLVDFNRKSALKIRRREDQGQDLWTVFNRIQEATIRGGLQYETKTTTKCKYTNAEIESIVNRSTRKITAAKRQIELNKILWTEAKELVYA